MATTLPLRIFLASPGGLDNELSAVLQCIEDFNHQQPNPGDTTYEVVRWEQVRGTARRPQEAINELIAECHFTVVLFKDSWGSDPGGSWGYTSGTEEEFFTALLALGQSEQPMKDIWLAFVDHASPDPQILALRGQIKERHALMYETASDIDDLKSKLCHRVGAWANTRKTPRHIDLLPSSGKDVLGAQRHRMNGEKLIELGQVAEGRRLLKQAAGIGGPVEHLAYARFLAREGNLEGATIETEKAAGFFIKEGLDKNPAAAAEAFAAGAELLRKQKEHVAAIGRFSQALTLLDEPDGAYARSVRCRILDQLGLAYQKTGVAKLARRVFDESLQIRTESEDAAGIAQSHVNLARLAVLATDLASAASHSEQAISFLGKTPPTALHANAEALGAEVSLLQNQPESAFDHAERSLALNRQFGSQLGEAISVLLLAESCFALGRRDDAQAHALESLNLNKAMVNEFGQNKAQSLLDQLASDRPPG